MPVYTYKCVCGKTKDIMRKVSDISEVLCPECSSAMHRYATGGSGSFVRGITVGKYYKEDRLRKKRNAELDVKQFERYGGQNKLVPNVNGEEVGTWKEASQIASDIGVRKLNKFDKYIDEEKNSQNAERLNERRLKALREKAKNIV